MKRSQDRDVSPRSKRSRSAYLDHEDIRDRLSPDMDRRGGGRYRDFDDDLDRPRARYRDDRYEPDFPPPVPRPEIKTPDYRSLCISGASSKIPDRVLKDQMYREFEKFGEMNVNVTYSGDQRVAYINFKYPEDARTAKHEKAGKMIVFDRPVRVEAVYNKIRSAEHRDHFAGGGGGRGMYHNYGNGMGRGHPPGPMGPPRRDFQGPPPPRGDFPPRDGGFQQREFIPKRAPGSEKFPHHLDHVAPEDDDKATRTLFVGNLDYNIEEPELRGVFEAFGPVEEIDIKRPQRGQGNAYAFVKFMNLDCAHRCKVETSGKYIGRFQCKIGYGKVTPSNCLWVGGLGPWVNHQTLEREFDRFGVIHRIEWPHGKNYAYVLYDNEDAAKAAASEMRGFPLGGQDRRLRVDFADPSHIGAAGEVPVPPPRPRDDRPQNFNPMPPRDDWGSGGPPPRDRYDEPRRDDWNRDRRDDRGNGYRSPGDYRRRSPDPRMSPGRPYDRGFDDRIDHRRDGYTPDRDRDDYRRKRNSVSSDDQMPIDHVNSMTELAKCLPVAWNGALILKNSAFPARMHVVSGDVTVVDTLMRDPTSTETPSLTIKQRLRLDRSKTEDVQKRIHQAGPHGHCILLAMPSNLQNFESHNKSIQQRPLKNLVTYLKQKEAAGVISLPVYDSKDKENVGLLHAFPPCQFGYDYLLRRAPKLPADSMLDDYIITIVVRGAV